MIHATHFIKYHSLLTHYFEYDEKDFCSILKLLNKPNSNFKGSDAFKQSITNYMAVTGYHGENIQYFNNFASYHGKILETQYLNNVQEHFVQKVKGFCTAMIVHRFQDDVPAGMNRNVHLRNLRGRARRVQNCCLSTNQHQDYHNLNDYDQDVVDRIRDTLPDDIHENGVSYDAVARATKYAEPYFQLGLLYQEQEMRLFNVFPLSTSSIPRHMTMDTQLLCNLVLHAYGDLQISRRKNEYWSRVFDLRKKVFKGRSGMTFKGMHSKVYSRCDSYRRSFSFSRCV